MLSETLGASTSGNMLTGKELMRAERGCNHIEYIDRFF